MLCFLKQWSYLENSGCSDEHSSIGLAGRFGGVVQLGGCRDVQDATVNLHTTKTVSCDYQTSTRGYTFTHLAAEVVAADVHIQASHQALAALGFLDGMV